MHNNSVHNNTDNNNHIIKSTKLITNDTRLVVFFKDTFIIVIASRVPPTLFRMFNGSMELHWVSISLALPLSLLRRPRVEPLGISEDLAKR